MWALLIDFEWDVVIKLNGFPCLSGLTSEYMRDHFIVFWDNGKFRFAVEVLMYVHLESDGIRAAVNRAIDSHSILIEPILIGLILRDNMSVFKEAGCVRKLATPGAACIEGRVAAPACREALMWKPPFRKGRYYGVLFADVSCYPKKKGLESSPLSSGT